MFLILPMLIIFGLIPLTQFAFNASSSDTAPCGSQADWKSDWAALGNIFADNTEKKKRCIDLTERQMTLAKVSVVSTWILVILSILSWIGRAFGLWCIP
jgi:hypothetical protein